MDNSAMNVYVENSYAYVYIYTLGQLDLIDYGKAECIVLYRYVDKINSNSVFHFSVEGYMYVSL